VAGFFALTPRPERRPPALNLGNATLKVFLALDPCDTHKSFHGLSEPASRHDESNPGCDSLSVFTMFEVDDARA
jgi:hypothetical protein